MLKYDIEIKQRVLLSESKEKILNLIYNLENDNWLHGLFTKIHKTYFFETDIDLTLHYIIEYEVFDDPEYKEIKERLEIGL